MGKELSLRSIRPLGADSLRGVQPGDVVGRRPKFEWVDPAGLLQIKITPKMGMNLAEVA